MSLTKFTGNTNVISQLADIPVQTGDDLKAKFDEAETAIKNYLNNTLTTEVDQLVATEKTALQGLITALGRQIRTEISTSLQARYHIGKIIIETENINPATYLGFGTWELWGQGKVPVGVDTEDEDFNTVEKTGGEKEHTLMVDEIPSHNHGGVPANNWGLNSIPSGTDILIHNYAGHETKNTSDAGGDQPHNNLQPYITCYMWKRVN